MRKHVGFRERALKHDPPKDPLSEYGFIAHFVSLLFFLLEKQMFVADLLFGLPPRTKHHAKLVRLASAQRDEKVRETP